MLCGAARFANPTALLNACSRVDVDFFLDRARKPRSPVVGSPRPSAPPLGLATLAKGPVGLVLPSGAVLSSHYRLQRQAEGLSRCTLALGVSDVHSCRDSMVRMGRFGNSRRVSGRVFSGRTTSNAAWRRWSTITEFPVDLLGRTTSPGRRAWSHLSAAIVVVRLLVGAGTRPWSRCPGHVGPMRARVRARRQRGSLPCPGRVSAVGVPGVFVYFFLAFSCGPPPSCRLHSTTAMVAMRDPHPRAFLQRWRTGTVQLPAIWAYRHRAGGLASSLSSGRGHGGRHRPVASELSGCPR